MSYDAKYPYLGESDGAKGVIAGRLRMNVAAGAASGVLCAVTPMKVHDQMRYVIDTTTWADLVADIVSVEAGGFKLGGASTSGHSLLVGWLDWKRGRPVPLALKVTAVAVSGSLVTVAAGAYNGIGPCRLYVKNGGSQNITAAKVQIGPDLDNLYDYDTTTFASLAAGAMLSLLLPSPVNAIKLLMTCAAGTTVSAWLEDEARQQG